MIRRCTLINLVNCSRRSNSSRMSTAFRSTLPMQATAHRHRSPFVPFAPSWPNTVSVIVCVPNAATILPPHAVSYAHASSAHVSARPFHPPLLHDENQLAEVLVLAHIAVRLRNLVHGIGAFDNGFDFPAG